MVNRDGGVTNRPSRHLERVSRAKSCSFLYRRTVGRYPANSPPAHLSQRALPAPTMNTDLPRPLASTFSPNLCSALLEGLEAAYEELPSRAEMPGFDNTVAGQAIYRSPHHWLPELAAEFDLEVIHENNALLYRVGSHLFTCQRVSSFTADIRSAFPRSYKAGLREFHEYHRGQMHFDFARRDHGKQPPLVLAHMGNRDDGLISAHLCRPATVEQGQIRSWEFAYELLGAETETAPILSGESVPTVEQIAEPKVRRRRRRLDGSRG